MHNALKRSRTTESDLARRLDVDEAVVRRMLQPRRATRIDNLATALEAPRPSIFSCAAIAQVVAQQEGIALTRLQQAVPRRWRSDKAAEIRSFSLQPPLHVVAERVLATRAYTRSRARRLSGLPRQPYTRRCITYSRNARLILV